MLYSKHEDWKLFRKILFTKIWTSTGNIALSLKSSALVVKTSTTKMYVGWPKCKERTSCGVFKEPCYDVWMARFMADENSSSSPK